MLLKGEQLGGERKRNIICWDMELVEVGWGAPFLSWVIFSLEATWVSSGYKGGHWLQQLIWGLFEQVWVGMWLEVAGEPQWGADFREGQQIQWCLQLFAQPLAPGMWHFSFYEFYWGEDIKLNFANIDPVLELVARWQSTVQLLC